MNYSVFVNSMLKAPHWLIMACVFVEAAVADRPSSRTPPRITLHVFSLADAHQDAGGRRWPLNGKTSDKSGHGLERTPVR